MGTFLVLMFFLLGAAAVAIMALLHAQQSANQLRQSFARVAEHFGGRLHPNLNPRARFTYNGHQVLIDTTVEGGNAKRRYTQLHIGGLDPTFRMQLYPETPLHAIGKLLGTQDIQIGSPQFDPRYMIGGNDPERVRAWLTPQVQYAIEQLRAFHTHDDIYIRIQAGVLLIKKRGTIRDYRSVMQLTQLGLALLEALSAGSGEGIEFLEGMTEIIVTECVCQVCGDQIDAGDTTVVCVSCSTPHHDDCWNYSGVCSTYGCGQTNHRPA